MASHPTFDPNKFSVRIKGSDWRELTKDPGNPLLNRAIQAQCAPGFDVQADCGFGRARDQQYRRRHHVQLSRRRHILRPLLRVLGSPRGSFAAQGHHAIVRLVLLQCREQDGIDNIAFYAHQPAWRKERDRLAERGVGHGAFDRVGTADGPPEMVCRRNDFRGDRTGATTVTPLQLARAIGGIAIGGVWHVPHLTRAITATEKPHEWTLNQDNVHKIVYGMYGVVNEGGTGVRAKLRESMFAARPGRRRWPRKRMKERTRTSRTMLGLSSMRLL